MTTNICSCFPPQPSIEEILEKIKWTNFYQSVLDKKEGLDRLINFFGVLLHKGVDSIGDDVLDKKEGLDRLINFFGVLLHKGVDSIGDDIFYQSVRNEVSNVDLYFKFNDALKKCAGDFIYCKDKKLIEKYHLNKQRNIQRVFERMKTGEPLYLLPDEDLFLAQTFIESLKEPGEF